MRAAILFGLLLGLAFLAPERRSTQAQNATDLREPAAFASITDRQARSRALFTEAAKVITHPRCMNCHPAGDRPTQGNDMHVHSPAVTRGVAGGGVPGNTCGACHMDGNVDILAGERASF